MVFGGREGRHGVVKSWLQLSRPWGERKNRTWYLSVWWKGKWKPEKAERTRHCTEHIVIVKSLTHVRIFALPYTVACQAPLSMGFPRQGYWNGLPFPSPDLPDPRIKPSSLMSYAWPLAGRFFTIEPTGKPALSIQFSSLSITTFQSRDCFCFTI